MPAADPAPPRASRLRLCCFGAPDSDPPKRPAPVVAAPEKEVGKELEKKTPAAEKSPENKQPEEKQPAEKPAPQHETSAGEDPAAKSDVKDGSAAGEGGLEKEQSGAGGAEGPPGSESAAEGKDVAEPLGHGAHPGHAGQHTSHSGGEKDAEDVEEELKDLMKPAEHLPRTVPADVKLTLAMFAKAVTSIAQELFVIANEWDDRVHHRAYRYAPMGREPPGPVPLLPRHVVSLPKAEAFSSRRIGDLVARAHVFIRSQFPFIARLDEDRADAFKDVGYDIFKAFFGDTHLFPMPRGVLSEEAEFWKNDDCFVEQFFNGCNPTAIELAASFEQAKDCMPKELLALSDPESGRSVEQLVRQRALLWADYSILSTPRMAEGIDEESGAFFNKIRFDSVAMEPAMTKYFYAPFVAFYIRKSDKRLAVLGIVLTRRTDRENYVYNADTCKNTPNIYTFAKMHVACADNQVHQFYAHLGRCHLVYEPFGVAVRNVFEFGDETAQTHAVGRILGPHFADHMAINWLARNTLIAEGGSAIAFTDAGFALGKNGGVVLLAAKYRNWKLQDQAFPAQLRLRGFDPDGKDGVSFYYYREDGMRIWRALDIYVKTVLEEFYKAATTSARDALVAADPVLDRWCSEMRDREKAFVPSFPAKFETVDQLRETITTIIYNVSAEHAAVNASQERYLAYVPNRPNSLFRPVPKPGQEKDMDLIREVLGIHRMGGNELGASQPLSFAMFQVQFAQLLTLEPSRSLMDLHHLKDEYTLAHMELMNDLKRIHDIIKDRNQAIEDNTPHLPPYEFLDPKQVGQSIEI